MENKYYSWNILIPFNPEISLLSIYPTEIKIESTQKPEVIVHINSL